jgi:hypothetical protein
MAREVVVYTKSVIDSTPVPRVNITQGEALPLITNDQGMTLNQYAVDESLQLHFFRPDFQLKDTLLVVPAGATPLTFAVYLTPRRSTLQGIVVDTATGWPLSGADIYAISTGDYSRMLSLDNGTYKIPVDSGAWRLFYMKNGYQSKSLPPQLIDFDQHIILPTIYMVLNSGQMVIQVRDDMGQAIFGASVRAFCLDGVDTIARKTGVTDFYGGFVFTAQPGAWTVYATKPGYMSDSVTRTVVPDSITEIWMTLVPLPGQMYGHIMDPDSQAIAGARIKIIPVSRPYMSDSCLSAGDGSYTISAPADTYRVQVSKQGYVMQALDIQLSSGQVRRNDFVLSPDVTIIKELLVLPGNAGTNTHDAFIIYTQDSPFGDCIFIRLIVVRPEVIDLAVCDMNGRKVGTVAGRLFERGMYTIKYPKRGIEGIYCIQARSKTNCVVIKILGINAVNVK